MPAVGPQDDPPAVFVCRQCGRNAVAFSADFVHGLQFLSAVSFSSNSNSLKNNFS